MKGKILGFSEAEGTGAISAEDGSRYRFARANWRGERPPATGTAVDFEGADGLAKEVYPVGGAVLAALGNINVDLGDLSGSPQADKVKSMFTGSLATPLAVVVLIACFLPAITSPLQTLSLFGLGDSRAGMGALSRAAAMSGRGEGLGMLETLLVLRFAAPLAATWLIWAAWSNKALRTATLVAGAAAIVAGLLAILMRSAVIDAVPDFIALEMSASVRIGMGVWLLLLAGGALLAAGFDIIRNPLAKV